MKKTFVILITVALLGILAASVAPGPTSTAFVSAASASTAAATTTTATQSAAANTTTGGYANGTYTGSTASNRFDEIKVAVTISGGKIASIMTPTLYGDSGRSIQINNYAVPQLTKQALAAQSSQIDGVSGASYTTEAYSSSLQSALDQAKA